MVRDRLIDTELTIGGGLNVRVFALLEAIDREGSIVSAARVTGLSYKGAWQIIDRVNQLSPRPLIESVVGGGHSKGTRLTETGLALLSAFRRLECEKERFLERINEEFSHDPTILIWFRRLLMKSSARNQWLGKVASINVGAVTSEVTIHMETGMTLVANLTHASLKSMDLSFGEEVLALVKSSMIILVTDMEGYRLSARNQLAGKVASIKQGLVTTDVHLDLEAGGELVASVTFESSESLGLEVGTPVTAIFKANSVILGVRS